MDTFLSIKVESTSDSQQTSSAIDKAITRMKELEQKFNYFSEKSEITKINNLKKGRPLSVSSDMLSVLLASAKFYDITEGIFNIAGKGNDWILDSATHTVIFTQDGIKLDLGGIAKGFIVDEGIKVLKRAGIKNAIINAGGDMYCLGRGRSGEWRVGIRDPKDVHKTIGSFTVRDKGVATSGGYERFKEVPGGRVSHIIDPLTGIPVETIFASVTVVAIDCMTADALATAVYVLGPERGMKLVEKIKDIECIIVGENRQVYTSRGIGQITLTKR